VTPVAGTVIAKNYLPFARVLAGSLRAHHPDCELIVALSDDVGGEFDPDGEPFRLLLPADLSVPELRDLAFRTTRREFAIALKPYLLERLVAEHGSALFLDPDMVVLGDLSGLLERVGRHALTLVPHAVAPPSTPDRIERELVLSRAGIFNGGVVGATRSEETSRFLHWWQQRVHRYCFYAVERGIHYDQRWLDLALGFVQDVHIHRDEGVNVAHWNLPERSPATCRLFHFSGFDPDRPELPTRYRPQLRMDQVGAAGPLFRDYAERLDAAGWTQARALPYAYGAFANRVRIPTIVRRLFAELPARAALGDPFGDAFFAWLGEGSPNRVWQYVYRARPDVQRAFRNPRGRAFRQWIRTHGVREHDVPAELV